MNYIVSKKQDLKNVKNILFLNYNDEKIFSFLPVKKKVVKIIVRDMIGKHSWVFNILNESLNS